MSGQEWPEERSTALRMLWANGTSTQEIADTLRITRNMVIGRAHRMNLPPRPSPILRNGEAKRPYKMRGRTKRSRAIKLPLLPSLVTELIIIARPIAVAKPMAVRIPHADRQCEWRIGDKPFLQCTGIAATNRPYCPNCCNKAYVRKTWQDFDNIQRTIRQIA